MSHLTRNRSEIIKQSRAEKHRSNPHEIYASVSKKFGTASRLKTSIANSSFWGAALAPGQTIQAYIASKRSLAKIIRSGKRTSSPAAPASQSGSNNGEDKEIIDKYLDDSIVETVLVGTRHLYESTVEALAEREDLTLDDLECRLKDAEESRGGVEPSKALKITTITATQERSGDDEKRVCSACGRPGHTPTTCWKVNPCSHCKKTGDNPRWCRDRPGKTPKETTTKERNRRGTKTDDVAKIALAVKEALQSVLNEEFEVKKYSIVSPQTFRDVLIHKLHHNQGTAALAGSHGTSSSATTFRAAWKALIRMRRHKNVELTADSAAT